MNQLSAIWILVLFVMMQTAGAQNFLLEVVPDKDTIFFRKNISYTEQFEDPIAIKRELQKILFDLHGLGYLAASFDSIVNDSNLTIAFLTIGGQYSWLALKGGNVERTFLNQIGHKEKLYSSRPFSYKQVRKLQERLLIYLENNGYPFASIKLDSLEFKGDLVTASLHLTKNRLITFDSIQVVGEAKIKKVYLQNYLGIKPGAPYNESLRANVDARIRELKFINPEKRSDVDFQGEGAVVNLYLGNKKVSQFNGILGVLPNNQVSGKLILTGELEVKLSNPFGTGKHLQFQWRKLHTQTQDLKIRLLYPYILSTPIGADVNFDIYFKDTSYIDIGRELGIQYLLIGGNYLKVFVRNKQTNLLSVDTTFIINSKALPSIVDVRSSTYGIGYKFEKLDYSINPRKGFSIEAKGGAGTRKIFENSSIVGLTDPEDSTFSFKSLYDSVKTSTAQYQLQYRFDFFIPFKQRNVIKLGAVGGGIWSEKVFENEMYKIGGFQLLRGFDEESIFASFYSVLTIEYRYLLSENSYFYLFGDAGYYENSFKKLIDRPFGFGAGLTFETTAGIFSTSYAIGRQFGKTNFSSGKIHLGYINYF